MPKQPKREPRAREMFADPVPNPYPEFDEEMFEIYLDMGIKADSLPADEAKHYAKWLKRQPKEDG